MMADMDHSLDQSLHTSNSPRSPMKPHLFSSCASDASGTCKGTGILVNSPAKKQFLSYAAIFPRCIILSYHMLIYAYIQQPCKYTCQLKNIVICIYVIKYPSLQTNTLRRCFLGLQTSTKTPYLDR